MNPTFSLRSLGCARSLVDSETMIDDLNQVGVHIVPEGSNEPITVLNTCSFIQSAIDETESNIRDLINKKKNGSLKVVVVAGCYPSRYKRHELEARFPEVDLWFTTQEEYLLKTKLAELVFKQRFQPSQSKPYVKLTPQHFSYLKISEGCNNWCSFCTIPKIRGQHTSKSIDTLLKEATKQIQMGATELVLIAEDTTCWGEDLYGKPSFPKLLKELASLPVQWIRPMYIFPSRVDDELINVIREHDTIANYIDMPIQHVNSMLLHAMNRKHDKDFLYGIMTDMFAAIPDLAFRTTFITGFPGETDTHVNEILQFLEDFPVAHCGAFTYSKEHETRSARMKNPVDLATAEKRLDTIMKKQYDCLQQRLPKFIGQTRDVVYEGKKQCRSYYEAPDVDGVIVMESNCSHFKPSDRFQVTITGHSGYDLLATLS